MHRLWKNGTVALLAAVGMAASAPRGVLEAQGKAITVAKVDVVIERYQGDKKASSLPFSLWVTMQMTGNAAAARGNGSIRIGVDVPIGTTTRNSSGAGPAGGTQRSDTTVAPEYRNIGTSIDCNLTAMDDGRFMLGLNLQDMSLYDPALTDVARAREQALAARGLAPATAPRMVDASAFRTFSFQNSLPMHDGQTVEFVNATDKLNGEVIKTLVTLTIAK